MEGEMACLQNSLDHFENENKEKELRSGGGETLLVERYTQSKRDK